jgi:hypothetical protein
VHNTPIAKSAALAPTALGEKEIGDVGQQAPRRPGGSIRSGGGRGAPLAHA